VEEIEKGVVENSADEVGVEKYIEHGVVEKESDNGVVENERKEKKIMR